MFYVLAAFVDLGRFLVDAHDPDGDNRYHQPRTGLALPYSNWRDRQPSDTNEKCACVHTPETNWNDINCGLTVAFVCEYDLIWIRITVPLLSWGAELYKLFDVIKKRHWSPCHFKETNGMECHVKSVVWNGSHHSYYTWKVLMSVTIWYVTCSCEFTISCLAGNNMKMILKYRDMNVVILPDAIKFVCLTGFVQDCCHCCFV